MELKYKIFDIPVEFVQANLSNYQKDIIELKYHVYKRFEEIKTTKAVMDCYLLIAEETCLQWGTVQSFILKIDKALKK